MKRVAILLDRTYKIIIGGILLGILMHFILVSRAYYKVKDAIRESSFLTIVFKNDPAIGNLYSFSDNQEALSGRTFSNNKNYPWRLLVNLGVLNWNSSLENLSTRLQHSIEKVPLSEAEKYSTGRYLLTMAKEVGAKQGEGMRQINEDLFISCLANGPGSYDKYAREVIYRDSSSSYENPLAFLFPREFGFFWGKKTGQQELINLLFIHTRIAENFDGLPGSSEFSKDPILDPAEEYQQVNEFFQRLALSVDDDPKVIAARNWYTIVEGPEQFFMYVVFCVGLLILLRNAPLFSASIQVDERSKRFSITLYKWIAIALPSLGFIGTKRGLSAALSRADTIVRAGSETNQALAVSNVSETMGIAFTSTLVGLVLLMLLMMLDLALKYYNHKWDEQQG